MAAALPPLNFPPGAPLSVRRQPGGDVILDPVRRRYVRLTPEEWVRQHLLRTLIEHLGYPPGLLSVEVAVATTAGARRPDVVAFDQARRPVLIAECKAPTVVLGDSVLEQVSRYNVVAGAPVLLVTNGVQHYCWRVDPLARAYRFLETIPHFAAAA